ncbi:mucin-5AC-like [Bacillus rossius redtenbacheri]|uniref:mucin-5AC-like n=1 Tax=Bacillus rossius redtenbacheri TaxID=93214 RepID=UPI002FDD83C7
MGPRRRQLTAALVLLSHCLLSHLCGAQQTECSRLEYGRCIHMADPLLRDPDYVFPDNVRDIGRVCSLWGQFVSCVQSYTLKCFSESRQVAFDKGVQDTKESMRQMCQVSQYQTEYLRHASCMKSMLTRDEHCGKHYQHLVRQVYGEVTRSALCCSHHIFRECMISEVRSGCDGGADGGQASRFTRHTLDKALSFLREQCYSYVPSGGECAGLGLAPTGRAEDARASTLGVDRSPGPQPGRGEDRRATAGWGANPPAVDWAPTQAGRDASTDLDGAWTSSSRGLPSLSEGTDDFSPWYPRQSDTAAAGSSRHSPSSVSHPDGTTTPLSRPSSFGRGMAWTPPPSGSWGSATGGSWTSPGDPWRSSTSSSVDPWRPSTSSPGEPWRSSTSSPGEPWRPSTSSAGDTWRTSTSSPGDTWRTSTSSSVDPWTPSQAETWRVTSGGPGARPYPYSTETWLPGAGNNVDEPNQQGLTVGSAPRGLSSWLLLASAVVAGALC